MNETFIVSLYITVPQFSTKVFNKKYQINKYFMDKNKVTKTDTFLYLCVSDIK